MKCFFDSKKLFPQLKIISGKEGLLKQSKISFIGAFSIYYYFPSAKQMLWHTEGHKAPSFYFCNLRLKFYMHGLIFVKFGNMYYWFK